MTFILPKQPQQKDIKPFVIVCEGMGDATFVDHLLIDQGIGNCCVGCPSDVTGAGSGLQRIPSYLGAIQAITQGRGILSGIAVVADADNSPKKNFQLLKKGFKDAQLPEPDLAYSISANTPIRVGVYLVPGVGRKGTLEDLLLEAAFKGGPQLEKCIDDFSACAGIKAGDWTPNQRAKMRLSALVAVTCQHNPWASSNTMWSDSLCPVPIDSSCFQEIKKFLRQLTK